MPTNPGHANSRANQLRVPGWFYETQLKLNIVHASDSKYCILHAFSAHQVSMFGLVGVFMVFSNIPIFFCVFRIFYNLMFFNDFFVFLFQVLLCFISLCFYLFYLFVFSIYFLVFVIFYVCVFIIIFLLLCLFSVFLVQLQHS